MGVRLLALDLSKANTGVAHCAPDGSTIPIIYEKGFSNSPIEQYEDMYDVARNAMTWFIDVLKVLRPEQVCIEAPIPAFQMNGQTNAYSTTVLHGLAITLGAVCKAKSVPITNASIAKVRKHFIGVGNLKGDVAKREVFRVCRKIGWNPPGFDGADAAAVYHWGMCRAKHTNLVPMVHPSIVGIGPEVQRALDAKKGHA